MGLLSSKTFKPTMVMQLNERNVKFLFDQNPDIVCCKQWVLNSWLYSYLSRTIYFRYLPFPYNLLKIYSCLILTETSTRWHSISEIKWFLNSISEYTNFYSQFLYCLKFSSTKLLLFCSFGNKILDFHFRKIGTFV